MVIELNTLSPKKWASNYGGSAPTLDITDNVRVGDIAIDTSTSPNDIWRCQDDTSGAPVWVKEGSTGGGISEYSSGVARIKASDTGVTFATSNGVGTLSIPAGVQVYTLQIDLGQAQLDTSDNYTVSWTYAGAEYNNTDADAVFPNVMVIDRSGFAFGGPGVAPYPYKFTSGGTAYQITALGSGSMDIKFISLGAYIYTTLILNT